jgi:(1->4)-alpha-D-glucan 1-alpha-D-glucosylmutase
LSEMIAAFPVYRSYAYPGRPVLDADRDHVATAREAVRQNRPELDGQLVQFVGDLVTGNYPGALEADLAVRFAQLSAAVMAKGVEDTAFYRYVPLTSLNEVGGDPSTVGRPVEDFHQSMAHTAARWPATMLTLSTHDTKRSADVRARINVLSELPEEWAGAVSRWAQRHESYHQDGCPDRNMEYLFYQTLVGAWPIEVDRAWGYMEKAAREAKTHTSWVDPSAAYEAALRAFVSQVLADDGFVADLTAFLAEHRIVERGRINSLAQTALLLTGPGTADLYQGTEVWNLSLVDPDNRRPVDYQSRHRLLELLVGAGPEVALLHAEEGGPKLWLIHRLLSHRRQHPAAYGAASGYEPLPLAGPHASHAVAFARTGGVAVVVPRLTGRLAEGWAGTTVTLPAGDWIDVLTDEKVKGGDHRVEHLFRRFPVAVLGRRP